MSPPTDPYDPAAAPTAPAPTYASEPAAKPQITEAETQMLQDLYTQLKPEAQSGYVHYFLARTPAQFQQEMKDIVEADLPAPPA